MSTDRKEQLIAHYIRARAGVEVPPDLLVRVRAGIDATPQAPRFGFAAFVPIGLAVVTVAVVGLVAIVGLRPAPVGPSASGSPGPSVAIDQKAALRVLARETDDSLAFITFYLGRLDGRTQYEETMSGQQLGEEGWFGPFGEGFLRLGKDGAQSTVDLLTLSDPTPRRLHTDEARIAGLTMRPDGAWVYLSRTDADSGDDLGIWRLPVTGGDLTQVLQPDAQRPTPPRPSNTVFFWTPDGSQVLVQRCRGERVPGDDCTWTAIDGDTGEVLREIVPAAPAGIIVGIANDRLLAGRDCDGISCDASFVDFTTGAVTDVDVPGARETLIESSEGPILLTDGNTREDGYVVTATVVDSGRTWAAYTSFAPVLLVTLERGVGGVQLDPGWFAVASEGQLGPVQLVPPVLLNALDGRTFEMGNLVPEPSPPPSASGSPTPTAPSASPPPGYEVVEGLPITVLANHEADALFRQVDTCISAAGYTVEFPAGWYTNPAVGETPACSWFAPEPFDVSIRPAAVNPPPPDGVWIHMGVADGAVGYTSITPIYMTEDVRIGGYEGHRAEFGPSGLDEVESRPGYRAYHYVVPFEEFGPTFAAGTDVDQADDYPLAKAVLDRIVASVTFQER